MRIGLIAPPWVPVPPPAYGGTEAVIDALARGLQGAGHDVTLFATGDSTCPVPRASLFATAQGIGHAGPATELRQVVHAYEALRDVDVVHDHTLTGPLYARHQPDLPVVATNHGPFDEALGDIFACIATTHPVIAISHHQASTAAPTPIAAVIHHGLVLEEFTVGAGLGGYAAFLGRMNPEKNVHTAIRIARAAGMPLRIAAKMREPAEHAYFEAMVRPLLGGDVEYLGELSGAEKQDLLGGAICLLNPIAWPEPFGMVMIEALACGTPVVATPEGAAPEIVRHGRTGFLAATADELAASLRRVTDIDRRACRRDAEERFSHHVCAAKHVELYERVVADRSRARPLRSA